MSDIYPFVIVIDQWATRPIFHAGGGHDEYDQFRTRCGVIHFTAGGHENGIHLPRRHAVKWSRPCRRCFAGAS